ncbi:MAG: inorganic phosphate transporter [Gemmatimonadetes bacterium]|nr:inorganic phosphate transporter [Gemmatimonadota bacterium]MCZ0934250.1 inorganic phosphate transporter [Candidatus Palauibacter rhopaloidicola]
MFETIALLLILGLATFDLWVGVANDAVNFLNSAFGSRVARRRLIMIIATIGILLGAFTSSGLMEVARRGVFDPSFFTNVDGTIILTSILALYLGVMAADVLLLDLFNTFGLPTSTTVSIVSELVGASIAVAFWTSAGGFREALEVINTGPVLGIYTAIFLSVITAFVSAAAIMWLVRILYGFDLKESFPRWGWLWTGVSFSAMGYFVLFKGLQGAALLGEETMTMLREQIVLILAGVFVLSSLFALALRRRPRTVVGVIVLTGTGALSMAFAGNDLVNFIGPSVAAFQAVLVEGVDLSGRVPTPPWALLAAGIIMAVALIRSRKARRVTDTEIRLAAQSHTPQRFRDSKLGTSIATWGYSGFLLAKRLTPRRMRGHIEAQTAPPPPDAEDPPYDLLRASVNLTVAAMLISIGTANKLPLSTTYITFMAAMGASFGDRTWTTTDGGQRVTGIMVVLGGWLLTGLIAAAVAFMMASLIVLTGAAGLPIVAVLVAVGMWRLGRVHRPEPEHG